MGPSYRANRSPDQLLLSVIGYCLWRAGECWRRSSDRNHPERWDYMAAVRLLESVRYSDTRPQMVLPALDLPTSPTPQEAALCRLKRLELVDALMAANPVLTDRKLLSHLPRPKLAKLVVQAETAAAALDRRRA